MTTATKSTKSTKSTKATTAPVAVAITTENQPSMFTGMEGLSFGEVTYAPIEYCIDNFQYLWQYDKTAYARSKTTLTKDEIESYKLALLLPTGDTFYYRVLTPFLIWEKDGKQYLINGNSRMQTLAHVAKTDKSADIQPIPYQIVTGDISKIILDRLQYDFNDTTRTNPVIEKYRRINGFINQAIESGMKASTAKQYISKYFGISEMTISSALRLCSEDIPQILEELIQNELGTCEGAIKAIQAAKALEMPLCEVVGKVIAHNNGKLSENGVKRWRTEHEAMLKAAEEKAAKEQAEKATELQAELAVNAEQILDAVANTPEEEVNELPNFEPDETEEIATAETVTPTVLDITADIENSNMSLDVLLRMTATYCNQEGIPQEDLDAITVLAKKILLAAAKELPEVEKRKIQKAIKI